jgi:hydroxyacylglutathione hydrolase
MILRRVYDETLAQASYFVACPRTHEAILFDPARDIDRYEKDAATAGLAIVAVAETHLHADFLSGMNAFAATHPVTAYVSGLGALPAWVTKGPFHPGAKIVTVRAGDEFTVGTLRFRVRHTPGHTTESVSYEVLDADGRPQLLVSGDFLFAGDVGRPDLGFLTSGGMSVEEAAERLRTSLEMLDDLPGDTMVLPGHGAGSACGKLICRLPRTTLGIERVINNPLRSKADASEFLRVLLKDQPDPPPYFSRVKKANEEGAAILERLPQPRALSPTEFAAAASDPRRVVVDTRPWAQFLDKHWPGSISAGFDPYFGPTVANYVEPGDEVIIVAEPEKVETVVRLLARVGIDAVHGFISPKAFDQVADEPCWQERIDEVSPCRANQCVCGGGVQVVDVRSRQEFEAGHLADAVHIPFIQLPARLGELDPARDVLIYCRSGNRSARAGAYLARRGFKVMNMRGGYWPYAGRGFATEEASDARPRPSGPPSPPRD